MENKILIVFANSNFPGVPYFTLLYIYKVIINLMHKSCIKKRKKKRDTSKKILHTYIQIYMHIWTYICKPHFMLFIVSSIKLNGSVLLCALYVCIGSEVRKTRDAYYVVD